MEGSSHAQRALALLHKQGFLRTSDLDTIDVPRVVLTRLSTSGQLERVGRGLYRLPDSPKHEHDGARLRIYSAAKTVADCFKHRNQIGRDVAALKAAWRTRKASADGLWRHAKVCRVANVCLLTWLEAVSHE